MVRSGGADAEDSAPVIRRYFASAARIRGQGVRYVRTFIWLLRDSIRIAPKLWLRLVVATLVFLGSNSAVIGVIYAYVRLLEHEQPIEITGFSLNARESVVLLAAVVAMLLTMLIVFSVATYVVRTTALRLQRSYHEYYFQHSLRLLLELPRAGAPGAAGLLEPAGLRRYVNDYPRQCGWTLRFIAMALPQLFIFIGAYGSLLLFDLETTLIVTLLGLGIIIAQYPPNLFAANASNVVDDTKAAFNARLMDVFEAVNTADVGAPRDVLTKKITGFFADKEVKKNMDAGQDRYRALELSVLSMQAGGGVALAVVVLTIGSGLLGGSGNWAILIVYATLLRLLLGSATSVFRSVAVFSRFTPYIHAYRNFVIASTPSPHERDRAILPTTLTLSVEPVVEGDAPLQLEPGECCAVWSRGGATRELALALQAVIGVADGPAPAPQLVLGSPPSSVPVDDWLAGLRASAGVDATLGRAAADGATVLVADHRALELLEEGQWAALRRRLPGTIVYTVYLGPQPLALGEEALLIRSRDGVLHGLRLPPEPLGAERIRELRKNVFAAAAGGPKSSSALDFDDME